jgi:hypothetical protein
LSSIGLRAQLPVPPAPSQFDLTGFLQAATVNAAGDPLSGGTLTVNGHVVTVPSQTIVIMPATALSWSEMFSLSPAPYTGVATGMAAADVPAPMSTYEVHVVGNKTLDGRYVAGMINISQQGLNTGAGYVNFIDYATGEIFVGGTTASRATGARVAINDPIGRYGRAVSPDPRFTVDVDNPTIASATGFPMCLPRSAAADALCPQLNRTVDAAGAFTGIVNMTDPRLGVAFPNPLIQVPIEVGDYVTFAGTLVHDGANPTAGPNPGIATNYISAHTIIDNIAVYTAPGSTPVYVGIEVSLIGTGGLTVLGAGEAAIRTRFEGMTTDASPSRRIHLYGMDFNPATGAVTDRDWGTIGIDPGPLGGLGAVQGRWRFRPPCLPFGSSPTKPDKQCVMNAAGTFLPPTREVRAVVETVNADGTVTPAWVPGQTTAYANGIIAGQFHAPIGEYIFPENIPGTPVPPDNFEELEFLSQGGYSSATPGSPIASQLSPWPGGAVPPCATCATVPVVSASTNGPVPSGGVLNLNGSATGNPAPSFTWVQLSGPAGVIANPLAAITTFTAPVVPVNTDVVFQLTATNSAGSASTIVTATVSGATAPTVSYLASVPANPAFPPLPDPLIGVPSGSTVSFQGICADALPGCTVAWNQTNIGAPGVPTVNTTGNPASFTVVVPAAQPGTVVVLRALATNAIGLTSEVYTCVTFLPPADLPAITSSQYRTSKQRLILTAGDNVSTAILTLQPYVTTLGTIFDPRLATGGGVFVNGGLGIWTLDAVGYPQPAVAPATPLTIKSNFGGTSAPFPVQSVRQ